MANNRIAIRRTSVSGRVPNTSQVNIGELALNLADQILYSSNGSTVFELGANNTNVNISGNATIAAIIANGSIGLNGQTLTSNGSAVYWSAAAGTGTVTQVNTGVGLAGGPLTTTGTLSVNQAYSFTWTNVHTFNANVNINSELVANSANIVYDLNVGRNVNITGNLVVSGSVISANVSNLDIKDLNITVAKGAANAAAADGAGLTVDGANVGWYYSYANNSWQSNVGAVFYGNTYVGGILTATGNLVLGNTSAIIVNGSSGANGQILMSNGGSTYWANATGGVYTSLSSNTTAIAYTNHLLDTSNGVIYVNMPASPANGVSVVFADGGGDKYVVPAIIQGNGSTINESNTNLYFDIPNYKIEMVYTGTTWKVFT